MTKILQTIHSQHFCHPKKNSGHLSSKPRVLGARRGFHPAGLHHVHCTGAESGSMAVFSGVSDAPWSWPWHGNGGFGWWVFAGTLRIGNICNFGVLWVVRAAGVFRTRLSLLTLAEMNNHKFQSISKCTKPNPCLFHVYSIYNIYIYIYIYLSTYLPIYLSTYPPIHLSTYLPIYLSIYSI